MKTSLRIIVGAFLAMAAFVAFVAAESYYYQVHLGRRLDADLGFTHGTPYVRCEGGLIEVLTIESIVPGGVMEKAGLRMGDIVRSQTVTGLYRTLHRARGKEVVIDVVDGGDGLEPRLRPVRKIKIAVPIER